MPPSPFPLPWLWLTNVPGLILNLTLHNSPSSQTSSLQSWRWRQHILPERYTQHNNPQDHYLNSNDCGNLKPSSVAKPSTQYVASAGIITLPVRWTDRQTIHIQSLVPSFHLRVTSFRSLKMKRISENTGWCAWLSKPLPLGKRPCLHTHANLITCWSNFSAY